MKSRIGYFLFGLVLFLPSAISLLTGTTRYFRGVLVSPIADYASASMGIVLLYYVIFKPSSLIANWYICPKCKKSRNQLRKKDNVCPLCNVTMQEMGDYYKSESRLQKKQLLTRKDKRLLSSWSLVWLTGLIYAFARFDSDAFWGFLFFGFPFMLIGFFLPIAIYGSFKKN